MTTEEQLDIEDGGVQPQKRRRRRRLLQLAHLIVLPLLLFLFLLYVVERQLQPFYGWIDGTPVERICLRVLPMVWRNKSFLERQALNAALTPEERSRATVILQKMEAIRPSHALHLKSGDRLFGRLREVVDEPGKYVITLWDGRRLREREVTEEDIVFRKVIVYPDEDLTPRDLRFLLSYPDRNHYYLHPHLIVTDRGFAKAFEIHLLLGELASEFEAAFGPLIESREVLKTHICHFDGRAALAAEAAELGEFDLINSSSFFLKSDNRLFLCEPEAERRTGLHMLLEDGGVGGERENWFRLVRHEGAHQMVSMYAVFRDFEQVPFWIEEGLAQYCERTPLRAAHPEKLRLLQQAAGRGQLLDWGELMAMTQAQPAAMAEDHVKLAYAQAWFLFRYCMDNGRRGRFMQYLVLEREFGRAGEESARRIRLMNALEVTATGLARDLTVELRSLTAPRKEPSDLN